MANMDKTNVCKMYIKQLVSLMANGATPFLRCDDDHEDDDDDDNVDDDDDDDDYDD